jgi:REP element-mobilizing transposase RayT
MAARSRQLPLELRSSRRGGARPRAGRKPRGPRSGVAHTRRPGFASRRPVHVTLRLRREVGHLRGEKQYRAVHRALCDVRALGRADLRVVHYSVQSNHVHLLVEADCTAALSRGMQGLVIRVARKLNAAKDRAGRVFADRYHAVTLETPRQTRAAIAYVLNNARRHAAQGDATYPRAWLDPCSSAEYFDGWHGGPAPIALPTGDAPIGRARTWMLRTGWRRARLVGTAEIPGPLTWLRGLAAATD